MASMHFYNSLGASFPISTVCRLFQLCRLIATALAMMLVSLVITSEVATAQVTHQTEFQTENLLKAGNSLDREMRAAGSKGCLTDEELKKFAARIERLVYERDRMAFL